MTGYCEKCGNTACVCAEARQTTVEERCPCGCGIFMVGDDWYEQHFGPDHLCLLCGKPSVSSKTGRVTLRDGREMTCPLCSFFVAMTQVRHHAEMLVEARRGNPT